MQKHSSTDTFNSIHCLNSSFVSLCCFIQFADNKLNVRASGGDTHRGGLDFDYRLLQHCIHYFKTRHRAHTDICCNLVAVQRLRLACERAKWTLSSEHNAVIQLPALHEGIHFSLDISRLEFEELCSDLFLECIAYVAQAIQDARMTRDDIDVILVSGGGSYMPKLRSLITHYFAKDRTPLLTHVDPEQAVVIGAALQAACLTQTGGDLTAGLSIVDVAPLSLGVDTAGDVNNTIIERHTPIPCKRVAYFSTYADNQSGVTIQVHEGERIRASENRLVAAFDLLGIPPMPRGVPQIEVEFHLDANGILRITACEKSTGVRQQITVRRDTSISKQQIDAALRDADSNRYLDEQHLAQQVAKSKLEQYVYGLRTRLQQLSGMPEQVLTQQEIGHLHQLIEQSSRWLEMHAQSSTVEYITRLITLQQLCQPMILKLYSPHQLVDVNRAQQQQQPQPQQPVGVETLAHSMNPASIRLPIDPNAPAAGAGARSGFAEP